MFQDMKFTDILIPAISAIAAISSAVTAFFSVVSSNRFNKAQIKATETTFGREYREAMRNLEGAATEFENKVLDCLYSTIDEKDKILGKDMSSQKYADYFQRVKLGLDSLAVYNNCDYEQLWERLVAYHESWMSLISVLKKHVETDDKYKVIADIKNKYNQDEPLTDAESALFNDFQNKWRPAYQKLEKNKKSYKIKIGKDEVREFMLYIDNSYDKKFFSAYESYLDAKSKVFVEEFLSPFSDR